MITQDETREKTVSVLREIYLNCCENLFPQRAKGFRFTITLVPFLVVGMFLADQLNNYLKSLGFSPKDSVFISGMCFGLLFVLFESTYSERKRQPRINFSKYPDIKPVLDQCVKDGMNERCSNDVPALVIGGEIFFLVHYLISRYERRRLVAENLTGWVLLNTDGEIIQSTELFLKAFKVLMHSRIGGLNGQRSYTEKKSLFNWIRRRHLPRAIRFLNWRIWNYESEHLIYIYQMLSDKLVDLQTALNEVYDFLDVQEKIRKLLGYSYGTEYLYEDALVVEKLNQAFVEYMQAAYIPQLLELNFDVDTLVTGLRQESFWDFLWLSKWSFRTIQKAVGMVLQFVQTIQTDEMLKEYEWQAYVDRLKYIRDQGIPIVEIGEFSEEFPHSAGVSHGG
jgi:hypothetical protein